MITLWNAALLAALGPLFVLPMLVRRLVPARTRACKGDAK